MMNAPFVHAPRVNHKIDELARPEYVVLSDRTAQYQPFHVGITRAEHHRPGGFFLDLNIHVNLIGRTRNRWR